MPQPHQPVPGYDRDRTSHASMVTSEAYQAGYQQALNDFAILPLLYQIQNYSDASFDAAWAVVKPQEAKSLANSLIQGLTTKLDGNLLACCLDALRSAPLDIAQPLASLQHAPTSTDLPAAFPNVEVPQFLYGDRLCWISDGEVTDWGIVIGRFYSFAPHYDRWRWCYLLWLDSNSPSAAWLCADVAWENDLKPFDS
jgi:hypothetical protein